MISSAIREHKDEFDPILGLLMRDDILAWYIKLLAKTDSKTQELERQLIKRVQERDDPVDVRVGELYEAATNPKKLCMMPANYHAWL
jgi:phosphatidylinositol kinase/protein kinase (PI-3  family)